MPHNQLEIGMSCENKANALKEIGAAVNRVQMGNAGSLFEENKDAISPCAS